MPNDRTGRVIEQLRRTVLLRDEAAATDGQLLERFVSQRDQTAFAGLVHRHAPMVWGVCRRILPQHQDAEDAFQATFLVLVRKAASIVPRDLVGNWLHGVAQRVAQNARSGITRRRLIETQPSAMPEPAAAPERGDRELRALLDDALSRLPGKYRVAIVLCDLGGRTRKDAAQQLGVPEGTLSGRLSRGRALLAKRLARHGLPISGVALAGSIEVPATAAPATLVSATIQAAISGTGGAISARVAVLVEGVLKAMLFTKLKVATVVVLALTLPGVGAGVGWFGPSWAGEGETQPAQAQKPQPKGKDDAGPPRAKNDFKIFKLRNATAANLAKVLSDLLQAKGADDVRLVADPASNSVLARGSADQLEVLDGLIARLDDAEQAPQAKPPQPKQGPPPVPTRVETLIIALKHAQAVEMAKTLQQLLQGSEADVFRIAADPRSNSVVVRGGREQIRTAEELIARLEVAAQDALETGRGDPTIAATLAMVTAHRSKELTRFSAGPMSTLEGLSIAVLASCGSAKNVTREQWVDGRRSDHLRVTYTTPRLIGIAAKKNEPFIPVSEIAVPISDEQGPILVRFGESYWEFSKVDVRLAQLFRNQFKELEKHGVGGFSK